MCVCVRLCLRVRSFETIRCVRVHVHVCVSVSECACMCVCAHAVRAAAHGFDALAQALCAEAFGNAPRSIEKPHTTGPASARYAPSYVVRGPRLGDLCQRHGHVAPVAHRVSHRDRSVAASTGAAPHTMPVWGIPHCDCRIHLAASCLELGPRGLRPCVQATPPAALLCSFRNLRARYR